MEKSNVSKLRMNIFDKLNRFDDNFNKKDESKPIENIKTPKKQNITKK